MIDTYNVGILMVLDNGKTIVARPNTTLPPKAVVALDAFIACSRAGMYDLAVPEPMIEILPTLKSGGFPSLVKH